MEIAGKATKLKLTDIKSPQIRTFWITAIAFFMCFFAWFGIVPFMPAVKKSLGMSGDQANLSVIVAVSGTIFARLLLGKLCDKYGPRLCYTWMLLLGSLPVMGIAFVQTYEQFLFCRLLIGFIGASFVITQVHTSLMFAPNCVGTANATSAGWGNLGGGANRMIMPIIALGVVACGVAEADAWRWSMGVAGVICFLMGLVYYKFTQDTPEGNFKDLKAAGKIKTDAQSKKEGGFLTAAKDYRSWILFLVYAGCFGIELTVYGKMDDYLQAQFSLSRGQAGTLVACFALMNIFARTTGGFLGDKFGIKKGLKGRVQFLMLIMVIEGLILASFSQITYFPLAIVVLILFSLSVQMAEGATFTVVPFINKKCVGSVSGIVGAGGNAGAVLAAWLIREKCKTSHASVDPSQITEASTKAAEAAGISNSFLILGGIIVFAGIATALVRFSAKDEEVAAAATKKAQEEAAALKGALPA
ncbi:major facilitator superfamily MFS_1 [Lentisphaera araneosa HTCC2155]|uniref:Major facilitator superfamily MFS_1 n=1 Tax=Lentisphaera araneosa HTCC2155 TaxID=313628 RepID=A6DPB8_9BACT|nr:MFS transporter [Lentisphaera araneosa]EDM26650.1 major facilitator superfamily MFS_1 [Lentisphaera araneosa HTCC2155]